MYRVSRTLVGGQQQHGLVRSSTAGDVRAMSSFVDKLKNIFLFKPGATSYEQYAKKSVLPGKGFRYPSPGSRTPKDAFVPRYTNDDYAYDTKYYTRDTARNNLKPLVAQDDLDKIPIPSKELDRTSSKGNKNPAVLRYDPTGTRSAMSTTWEAMDSELEKHQPNHLCVPWWEKEGIDLEAEAKAKGIPTPVGKRYPYARRPASVGEW